jgi:hypothetical protein
LSLVYLQGVTPLELVVFGLGKTVYESGGRLNYVYFPTSSLVSLLYTMQDGSTAEMGLAGNDGVAGVAMCLGGDTTPNRAVVQIAGGAFMMRRRYSSKNCSWRCASTFLAALYTGTNYPDFPDGSVRNRLHPWKSVFLRWLLLCL